MSSIPNITARTSPRATLAIPINSATSAFTAFSPLLANPFGATTAIAVELEPLLQTTDDTYQQQQHHLQHQIVAGSQLNIPRGSSNNNDQDLRHNSNNELLGQNTLVTSFDTLLGNTNPAQLSNEQLPTSSISTTTMRGSKRGSRKSNSRKQAADPSNLNEIAKKTSRKSSKSKGSKSSSSSSSSGGRSNRKRKSVLEVQPLPSDSVANADLWGSNLGSVNVPNVTEVQNLIPPLIPRPKKKSKNRNSSQMDATLSPMFSLLGAPNTSATSTTTSSASSGGSGAGLLSSPSMSSTSLNINLTENLTDNNNHQYESLQSSNNNPTDSDKVEKRKRRAEMNKIHSRVSRRRQKEYLSRLEQKVAQLESENNYLRSQLSAHSFSDSKAR